jgi:serine/threonine-protein kinase
MAIPTGTRIGHYEVLSPLGVGGMGEVYRARDLRLKRDVALKILPESFASDPERLARFQREAEVLASLNHPHIAAIHGLEQGDGSHALVLELVQGDTLADRLARAPMPLEEALLIAKQIADAVEAAHQQGVIHRDLKPANVKVTDEGAVKVLDFGLAAIVGDPGAQTVDATQSPTLTLAATRAGVIMGTAAYMSPEQASGKAADRRADIWSFGVVLMEMLTGRRQFEGETISHTLAFVLTKEPDWSALPANTPPSIHRLLRRCLEKDRKRRLPDIGSARLEIEEALSAPAAPSAIVTVSPAPTPRRWKAIVPWVAAAAAATVAVLLFVTRARPLAISPMPLSIDVGADVNLLVLGAVGANLALSRAGDVLAFVGQDDNGAAQIYLRRWGQLNATPLGGTTGARSPFFSPDGRWVGFFAEGRLKKVSVTGGAPQELAQGTAFRGAAWLEDGSIVYAGTGAPNVPMLRLMPDGTSATFLPLADGELGHRWPQALPGDRALIFTANRSGNADDSDIVIQVLPNGPRKVLQQGAYFGRYVSTGHLLYVLRGTLFAAPFDLDTLEVGQGEPFVEGVASSPAAGAVQLAIAENGTLVYRSGVAEGTVDPIVWMDRKGISSTLRSMGGNWSNPAFAPDGSSRIAMDEIVPGTGLSEIVVYDWNRDTLTRLTFNDNLDVKPVWTPDARRLAWGSSRVSGRPNVWWQSADGSGQAQRLTSGDVAELPGSWHPTLNVLAFQQQNAKTGWDILILPVVGSEEEGWKPGDPIVYLNEAHDEMEPMFSPDGRWLMYMSAENQGRNDVFVRPFPEDFLKRKQLPGGKWQVSSGGGNWPAWSPVKLRQEIFYATATQQMMVAPYTVASGVFAPIKPTPLPVRFQGRNRLRNFALHPDGNRFAVAPRPTTSAPPEDKIVLYLNFAERLRRMAAQQD